jgi:CheY-like chemotaxis protein
MRTPVNILLAEDSQSDTFLIRLALREHQIDSQLFLAENGDRMVQLLEKIGSEIPAPDLLMLDLNLPCIDGPELFRKVRMHPCCSETPLVVVTSSDAPRDHDWTSEFRVSHYFRKPSSLPEFLKLGAVVRDLLSSAATA